MLHPVGRGCADAVGTRYHPRHDTHAVGEDHKTFSAAFPQFAGDFGAVEFQYVGQCNQVSGMAVHDHAILTVSDTFTHGVRLQMRCQF